MASIDPVMDDKDATKGQESVMLTEFTTAPDIEPAPNPAPSPKKGPRVIDLDFPDRENPDVPTRAEVAGEAFREAFKMSPEDAGWDLKQFLESITDLLEKAGWADRNIGISFQNLKISAESNVNDDMATITSTVRNLCSTPEKQTKTILNNISGYCKPGEMLLVLGAPGAGCSTFLNAIAGNLSSSITTEGSIFYNGEADLPNIRRKIRRVSDEDIHIPGLTVEQTFRLAAELNVPADHVERESLINSSVTNVLHVLGLYHVRHSLVGDENLRGVSGGEKKRVTIGEMLISRSRVVVLDDYSKGLDASAALDIVKSMRIASRALGISIVATQYQASQAIYNTFDKVLLLHKGEMLYFGSPGDALPYFQSQGFTLPQHRTIPDFLASLGDHAEQSAAELAAAFRGTQLYTDMKAQLQNVSAPSVVQNAQLKAVNKKEYATPLGHQIKKYLNRQKELIRLTPSESISRVFRFFMFSLIMGLTFLQLDNDADGVNSRAGAIFFLVIFVSFSSFGNMSNLFQRRSVFYKHRDAKFSSALSFHLANTITEIPFVVLEIALFVVPMYFMIGFNSDDSYLRLVYLYVEMVVADLGIGSFITFCACASPELGLGQAVTAGLMIIFVFFSGFLIQRDDIPPYFVWMHYLSPLKYLYEAAIINEFSGATFDFGGVPVQGDAFIADRYDIDYSDPLIFRWWVILILIGYLVFFNICSVLSLRKFSFSAQGSQVKFAHKQENHRKYLKKITKGVANVGSTIKRALGSKDVTVEIDGQTDLEPAYFTWHNLNYDVFLPVEKRGDAKRKKRLLDSVTGYVKPGMLMALMGSSGAGKTTLLDVLARRKTGGVVEGKVLVNGHEQDDFFKRLSGYVEQMDIHTPRSTVREAFTFAANMRLPAGTPKERIKQVVNETAELLKLTPLLDAIIGSPDLSTSLPVEVRKRVTIGVELVANPSILFMDEPTSGLDTVGALTVIQTARDIANSGRSVVCTIHQPSAELFTSFDYLLLMQRGGHTVYYGPLGENASTLIDYFTSRGAPPPQPDENPADYMLEQIGAGIGKSVANNWAHLWDESQEKKDMLEIVKTQSLVPTTAKQFFFSSQVPQPQNVQVAKLLHRQFRAAWRNPSVNLFVQVFNLAMGLFLGLCYLQLDNDQVGLRSRTSAVYFTSVLGAVNILNAMPKMIAARAVYNREIAAGMYRSFAYYATSFTVELPFILMSSLFFGVPLYWLVGLQSGAEEFIYFQLALFVFYCVTVSYGQSVAVWVPSLFVAQLIAPALMSLWNLFSGFLLVKDEIPDWFIWLYYCNPYTYFLEGVIVNELEGQTFTSEPSDVAPFATGDEFIASLDMSASHKWRNLIILVGWVAFFRLVTYLGLTYARHGTR